MRGTHWCTGGLALALHVIAIDVMASEVIGCGQAPPPPTAIPEAQRFGAGSKGQTETDVLTVRPSPDAVMPTPPPMDMGDEEVATDDKAGDDAAAPPDEPAPVAPPRAQQTVSACHETRLVGCDAVYVRVLKSDVCVQLVLDNCNPNDRQGLPVALPISWRLTSGSASTNLECDLREYDPKSQPALSATGTVTFDQQGREVSALDIDVRLLLDPAPESKVPAQIDVATPSPIADIDDCER